MSCDEIGFSVDVVIDQLQAASDPFALEVLAGRGVSKPLEFSLDVSQDLGWHLQGNIFGAEVIDMSVDGDEIEPSIVIEVAELATEAELIEGKNAEFGSASTVDEDTGKGLKVERGDFVVEVCDDDIEESITVLIAAGDPHAGLCATDCIDGNDKNKFVHFK